MSWRTRNYCKTVTMTFKSFAITRQVNLQFNRTVRDVTLLTPARALTAMHVTMAPLSLTEGKNVHVLPVWPAQGPSQVKVAEGATEVTLQVKVTEVFPEGWRSTSPGSLISIPSGPSDEQKDNNNKQISKQTKQNKKSRGTFFSLSLTEYTFQHCWPWPR